MNANARKWVEALRSGEFEQARSRLKEGNAYCCLGVACELHRRESGNGEWYNDPTGYDTFVIGGYIDASELPPTVKDWLGLRATAGMYYRGPHVESLAADNDNGATFDRIAATIESEPEGLFKEGVK